MANLAEIIETLRPFRDLGSYVVNHQLNLSNDVTLEGLSGLKMVTKGQLLALRQLSFKLEKELELRTEGEVNDATRP